MQYYHSLNYQKTHKTRIDEIIYCPASGIYYLSGYDRFTNTSGHQILLIKPSEQGQYKKTKAYTKYKKVAIRWKKAFETGELIQFSY